MKIERLTCRVLVCLSLICLSSLPVSAAHWPAWRGPNADGTTPEKNFPTQWSTNKNVRWRVDLPERGNSSPIVWGHRLFLTQALEKEGRRTVMCFDRATGKVLWQQGTTYNEKERTHETNPYCAASPVTDGQRVVATFGSAGVSCYDLDGKELWRRELGKQDHDWGYAASPVIHGGLCYVYHGPGDGAKLVALDKQTGQTVWQFDEPKITPKDRTDGFKGREPGMIGSWSTPLVVAAQGREELVMSFPQQLRAFDPKTGKDLWVCEGLNPLIYTSPVHGEGVVVTMGGFFGSALAVKPGGQGDVTATARVWREERAKKNRCGSCVISGGLAFFLNMEGFLECTEMATGKQLWEERLPDAGAKSSSWSSPVLANGLVYTVNQSGDTHVLRAAPKLEVVAVNSVGELSNSSLALSDGEIFLRTHQRLWCFSEKKDTAAAR
ncbi:MAG: PQQ-like beta-propeller repeat protein [Verrucomicrobia bacterium]|nr:PQQ-like beta-propeller repeat protein [Verrucomicrobiota bacterium]